LTGFAPFVESATERGRNPPEESIILKTKSLFALGLGLATLGLLLWATPGGTLAQEASNSAPAPQADTDRISALEGQIAQDRETIKNLISQSLPIGSDLATDPQLREISKRLPRLQQELKERRGGASP
jgi:hypothetical protein